MSNSNLTSIRRALKNIEAGLENVEAGGNIYGYNGEGSEFLAYADEELTTPLTYEEGKKMLNSGARLAYTALSGMQLSQNVGTCMFNDEDKSGTLVFFVYSIDEIVPEQIVVTFSDTPPSDTPPSDET